MFPAKSLQVVVIMVLWLSVFDFNFEAYGDDIKCDPPCQPVSGYPSYGTPPPPPSGYSIYTAPPPTPPPHDEKEKGQSKCPPASSVQCCTPPAPYTYGPPNAYNTYAPPNSYYAPPNPYTYVPYGEGGRSVAPVLLPFLVPMFVLFFSFLLF